MIIYIHNYILNNIWVAYASLIYHSFNIVIFTFIFSKAEEESNKRVFEDNLAELINTIIPDIYKLFRQTKDINAEEMIIEVIQAYITVGGSKKKKSSYANLSRVWILLSWWLIFRLNKIYSKFLSISKRYSSWSNQ